MNATPLASPANREYAKSISGISADLLRKLFFHHDGIVVGATILALHKGGLLDRLFESEKYTFGELRESLENQGSTVNAGYLHVALRCLVLQGWLSRSGRTASDQLQFCVTARGLIASQTFDRYIGVAEFIYSSVPIDRYLFGSPAERNAGLELLSQQVATCKEHWNLPLCDLNKVESETLEVIRHHLDGLLAGPLMIAIKMNGLLHGDRAPLDKMSGSRLTLEKGLELLQHFAWVDRVESDWIFTELGKLAGEFSLHYGLTWSYAPMFRHLGQQIFANKKNVTHVQPGVEEQHVDRTINVLASGVAHRRYFEDSDKIIVELFNREPLADQAKFVADMGCGDGEWLKRIYEVVKNQTLRGRHLGEYPLLMVGADYNLKAREVVKQKLTDAGVPNIVMFGDVGDPERFCRDLREHEIDICDGLHIRAFIDHNRPYQAPIDRGCEFTERSTGAYADQNGDPIPNRDLEQNLYEHLRKWVPYVEKHGLIILEAHNIDPDIASNMLGRTHATAFDTYHGFSNQYPVDFEAFIQQAERAGLRSVIYRQMLYPSRLPFVAISLNHFKSRQPVVPVSEMECSELDTQDVPWRPDGSEDLEDGNALHGLLYQDGDIGLPRRWCCYSTGVLVGELLSAIERRLEMIRNGAVADRTITVLDYGVGTGFATLELIKGLQEKGMLQRFKEAGVQFRLPVCDFPSGWFAKAHEILSSYSFVSFHSLKDVRTEKVKLPDEIFFPGKIDFILVSMVFHLIPPPLLGRVAAGFAKVLTDQGQLFWNTPDTAPALPDSDLIHSANRMLRKTLSRLLDGDLDLRQILAKASDRYPGQFDGLVEDVTRLAHELDRETRTKALDQAAKQILPVPTEIGVLKQALEPYFKGKTWVKLSVMTDEELLALALLPANQRNANEIQPRELREKLIQLLLQHEILPAIHAGHAGISDGMILHWTFGRCTKSS